MGVLNLVLATVALTAGFIGPSRPGTVAGASGSPPPVAILPSATAAQPTPAGTEPTPTATFVEPTLAPSVEPSVGPLPSAAPSNGLLPEPSAAPPTSTPNAEPIASSTAPATAQPTAPSTATPTAQPTPRPTARPTARPTPRPEPVAGKAKKPLPPCPVKGNGPPGHHKVTPVPARPCGQGSDNGRGGNAIVVFLPLALGGIVATTRGRLVRSAHGVASRRRARRDATGS